MCQPICVSVIIPVYNAEAYLEQCLDSVCNQTLDNIEVLCIDDGSTDSSLRILQEYGKRYSFVRVLEQPENMGAGPARNVGIDQAQGEYIAFMDADDEYCQPDTLEHIYACATAQNAKICGGGVLFTDGSVRKYDLESKHSFSSDQWISYNDYQGYFYYQRFFYKKDLLDQNNIRFPHYLRFEDPPFMVRAMLAAGSFFAMSELVYCYRVGSTRIEWTHQKVNDVLCGITDVLQMSRINRLADLYHQMLKRCLPGAYALEAIEDSLIHGNDYVVTFYRSLLESLDEELLSQTPKLDLQYAKTIAAWNGRRNMVFHARPIDLIDKPIIDEEPPKVSVVVPVYNTSKYLRTCIDSILAQTLKDIEVICIDDGSTDDGGAILDTYAQTDSRVRVFHQSNQGLSAARNAGLQHVHGTYVYFMDSDDILEKDALSELLACAEEHNTDVVFFGACSFWDEETSNADMAHFRTPMVYSRSATYPQVTDGQNMCVLQMKNNEYYSSACIQFLKTEFLRNQGLAFYEGILHEDELFTLAVLFVAKRTACMDRLFFKRRLRGGSIMMKQLFYQNVVSYYLVMITLIKQMAGMKLTKEAYQTVANREKRQVKYLICDRWRQLSRADRVLFLASLTEEDRIYFDVVVVANASAEGIVSSKPRKEYWIFKMVKGFIRTIRQQGFKKAVIRALQTVRGMFAAITRRLKAS